MTHAEIDNFLRMLCGHTLGHYETLRATYDIAAALIANGVPGDFVECGVYAGGECAAMALAIITSDLHFKAADGLPFAVMPSRTDKRRVHLFDSFQGMPQAGEHDTEFLEAGNKPGEACVSLEGVQANMRKWGVPDELLVYHPGWFQETIVPAVLCGAVERRDHVCDIALLRLDGDLYETTKVCLEHLYPRLVRGGACILDDYPLSGCRKAFHEVVGYPQPMYWWKSV